MIRATRFARIVLRIARATKKHIQGYLRTRAFFLHCLPSDPAEIKAEEGAKKTDLQEGSQTRINIATGEHRTGSPNKSTGQIGKNCPKNVRELSLQPLWTIFPTFFDILSTFCRHSLFLGCPTVCLLTLIGNEKST